VTPDQERLVADHVRYARNLAVRFCRQRLVPDIWRGDMHSAALEGLMQAAEAFDPDRGEAKFSTFARYRINGRMMDEYRNVHTGRRTAIGNVWRNRTLDESLQAIADHQRARKNSDDGDLDQLGFLADNEADPALIFDITDLGRRARDLIDELHWEERQIAVWYFRDGRSMADIGRRLGVTESRVCQRMGAVKRHLRELARRHDLLAA
jgi:RNA polymerase sigma factor for flagellar operon FliA